MSSTNTGVSIQMISPASGDLHEEILNVVIRRFHSNDIPSEWGLPYFKPLAGKKSRHGFRRSGKIMAELPINR